MYKSRFADAIHIRADILKEIGDLEEAKILYEKAIVLYNESNKPDEKAQFEQAKRSLQKVEEHLQKQNS